MLPSNEKQYANLYIIIIMVLTRSFFGTSGGHAPIISMHDTYGTEVPKTRYKYGAVSRPFDSAKRAALVGFEPPTSRPSVERPTAAPLV